MKERANTLVKQRAASREEGANNSLRAALHRTGRWEKKKKQERWKQLSHASLGKLIAEAAIQCRHIHLLLCVCQ